MTDQEPLYSSSSPVVSTGGTVQPDVARDLLHLEVDEGIEGLRRLVLHVVASATREQSSGDLVEYLDGSAFDYGRSIEVSIGPSGNEKIVFKGTISAIEVSFEQGDVPHVSVLAEDELMSLRMTQSSATYTQVSDADLAKRIASRHGLAADVALDGPSYDVVQQLNQSDLEFLRSRARLTAAELWAWDGTLHLARAPTGPGRPSPSPRATTCSRWRCAVTSPTRRPPCRSPASTRRAVTRSTRRRRARRSSPR